jgi:hypothetical protein
MWIEVWWKSRQAEGWPFEDWPLMFVSWNQIAGWLRIRNWSNEVEDHEELHGGFRRRWVRRHGSVFLLARPDAPPEDGPPSRQANRRRVARAFQARDRRP